MFPIVLSTNETYIRRLGDKYECTSAVQVRYSLDQQVACFLFHLDDEASGELRKVRMYHAWCSELDRKTKPNFTVRVPARVHKHCKVYAVAVKFKDPHSWLKFQPDMERTVSSWKAAAPTTAGSCCQKAKSATRHPKTRKIIRAR
ncbi:hypothetical protein BOX15_Mlig031984g2 [Macrostomum lignano]|uniref:Uncharacterized protein n=1 Tax=Macrostomum lignano TaxID=282301 RepID=A0A267DHV7_9PLAT|nr:hypothetical protein BOX15_Mlig031984g2 [Macrostomum lignano]